MNRHITRFLQDHPIPAIHICGKSMEPVLSDGQCVSICSSEPGIGDIVVYSRNNTLIAHRVWMKFHNRFFTMGDSSDAPDRPVMKEDILGVVPIQNGRMYHTLRAVYRTIRYGFGKIFNCI